MPQAKKRNTTTAAQVIKADQDAVKREALADKALAQYSYPSMCGIAVPELGRSCVIHSIDQLDDLASLHAKNEGLLGRDRFEFMAKICRYRTILQLQDQAVEKWREDSGYNDAEVGADAANEARRTAWSRLLDHIGNHPQTAKEMARYASSMSEGTSAFRFPQVLAAIGGRKI